MRNLLRILIAVCVSYSAYGFIPIMPYARAISCQNGKFILILVPEGGKLQVGKSIANEYEVDALGKLKPGWSAEVDSMPYGFLSNDGQHYIAAAQTILGQRPLASDRALEFYDRGRVVRILSATDFIDQNDFESIGGAYVWVADDVDESMGLKNDLFFAISHNGKRYVFDLSGNLKRQ